MLMEWIAGRQLPIGEQCHMARRFTRLYSSLSARHIDPCALIGGMRRVKNLYPLSERIRLM